MRRRRNKAPLLDVDDQKSGFSGDEFASIDLPDHRSWHQGSRQHAIDVREPARPHLDVFASVAREKYHLCIIVATNSVNQRGLSLSRYY